jgi:general secretion pathway protein K
MNAPVHLDRRTGEGGAVLLIVLAALTILTLFAAAAGDILRSRVLLAETGLVSLRREAGARAAVALSADRLLAPGLGRWRADGRSYPVVVPEAKGEVRLQAVTGLVNINRVSLPLLKSFLSTAMAEDQATALATAIIAARAERLGVENNTIGGQSRALLAFPDLTTVAALFSGEGLPPGLWAKVQPLLTLYGSGETIDPETAPREVLLAIPGMSGEDLRMLLQAREKGEVSTPAVQAMLARYRPFLIGADNGIYRVTVTLAPVAGGARGGAWRQEAVIMTGRDAQVAYHVLAWGWPEEVSDGG